MSRSGEVTRAIQFWLYVGVDTSKVLIISLFALLVMGCGASDKEPVTGPVAPTSIYRVPASIVADCSVDMTQNLHVWIASVPDSSTLVFGRDACYNIDGGLIITDRHGLTFEGNGSTFQVFSRSHRDRANWRFRSGSNLTLRNMIARGANANAGLAEVAYDTQVEGQHAYRFEGTQTALLDSVQAYDVYGDFVEAEPDWRVPFPGAPVRNLTVRHSRFERNGRMGIGLTHVDGFVLKDSYVGDVRWSAIDLELDDSRQVGKNIRIERNRFGAIMHYAFVSKGAGASNSVGSVVIRGNVMEAHARTCLAAIGIGTAGEASASVGRFWTGWLIEDNLLRVRNRGLGIDLTRVKQAVVRSNTLVSGEVGGCGLDAPMRFANSHTGEVTGNILVGSWPRTHTVDALTTDFSFSGNIHQ